MEAAAHKHSIEQHQGGRRTNGRSKSSSRQLQLHDVIQTEAQGLKPTCNNTFRAHRNSNGKNIDRTSDQTDVRLHSKTETYYAVGNYMMGPAKERALPWSR
jgi:hypothetical protein